MDAWSGMLKDDTKGVSSVLKSDAMGSWASIHMWLWLIENQSKRRWCHYSIVITLCNQHLLHDDKLKQKSCLLPITQDMLIQTPGTKWIIHWWPAGVVGESPPVFSPPDQIVIKHCVGHAHLHYSSSASCITFTCESSLFSPHSITTWHCALEGP